MLRDEMKKNGGPFTKYFALFVLAALLVITSAEGALVAGGGGNVYGGGQASGSGGNVGRRVTLSGSSNATHEITDGDSTSDSDSDGTDTSGAPDALRTALNTCVLDRDYEFSFFVLGGTAPFTWELVSGTLPEGLELDSSAGKVIGRCVETGDFFFDVKVTDSKNLSDTESFSLSIVPYEHIVPVFGLGNSEAYITHSGTTRETITLVLFEANGSNSWLDMVTLDPHETIKASDVFGDFSTGQVLRVYSDNPMSVQDVRYSSDKQKAWMFSSAMTTVSAGKEFLFPLSGWLEAGVFIGNAGYKTAQVHVDVIDTTGTTIRSTDISIPEYEARSTYEVFGNIYDGRDEVIVHVTSDTDIVVDAGAWNEVDRGGYGREILPLAKSAGQEFMFSSRFYQLAGATILNTSSTEAAVIDVTVRDADGTIAAGGVISGITVPAGGMIDTRDIAGLEELYFMTNPAVIGIEVKNGVDVVVRGYQFSTEDAGLEYSVAPIKLASGDDFSFALGEFSHATFDVVNAGSRAADVKVTINAGNATGEQVFLTTIPAGGTRNSADFISANLYGIYEPVVVRVESLDGTPLLVSCATFYDALVEGSIEGCGASVYPIIDAGEFRITDLSRDDETSDVTLSFTSLDGVSYGVMFSDDEYGDGMSWATAKSGIAGTGREVGYTDDGTGTGSHPSDAAQRYYKVVMSDSGRESANVVGLYGVHVEPGRNLISTPLAPFDGSLDSFIGGQLTGHAVIKTLSDRIDRWSAESGTYEMAYFDEAGRTWRDWSTAGDPAFGITSGEGYVVTVAPTHEAKDLMLLGEVPEYDRVMGLKVGENLVGIAYPAEVSLDDSGLISSGFTGGGSGDASDVIQWWNSETSSYDTIFYDTSTSQWRNWDGTPATRTFKPGQGVWITIISSHGEFDWVMPRPY